MFRLSCKYRDSRIANQIDPSVFRRGRDTFAGYNVLAIALSVPKGKLLGEAAPMLGFSGYTERAETTTRSRANGLVDEGRFIVIDRIWAFRASTPCWCLMRRRTPITAAPRRLTRLHPLRPASWVGCLRATSSPACRPCRPVKRRLAFWPIWPVLNGDYLRLDTSIRNTGGQGGNNEGAGFPNGRRLQDDVIDTVVTIINNFEPVRRNGKVDRCERQRQTVPK